MLKYFWTQKQDSDMQLAIVSMQISEKLLRWRFEELSSWLEDRGVGDTPGKKETQVGTAAAMRAIVEYFNDFITKVKKEVAKKDKRPVRGNFDLVRVSFRLTKTYY